MLCGAAVAAVFFALHPNEVAKGLDVAIEIDPLTLMSLVCDALAKMLVTAVVGVDAIASAVAVATHGLPQLVPDADERLALQRCYDVRSDECPAPAPALDGSPGRVVPEEAVPVLIKN